MSQDFLFRHYERYRKEAMENYEAKDFGRARFCFLKAAEYLFQLAQASEGQMRKQRSEQAQELLDLADKLPSKAGESPAGLNALDEKSGEDSPSQGNDFLLAKRPDISFDDIAGHAEVKEEICRRILLPYRHQDLAQQFGIQRGGGILLYGPPGTGKSLLARAVAGEFKCPFFSVKPSEILSKWVGEAEQNVAALFEQARQHEKAVIFIDEIEALTPQREGNSSQVMARLVPQILAEMEGLNGRPDGLLFLGATNEPWSLDAAILRPGRFDECVYVGMPDLEARHKILQIHLDGKPLAQEVNLETIAQRLSGYSGADIRKFCHKACDEAFVSSIELGFAKEIDALMLQELLGELKPSVAKQSLERYLSYEGAC